MQRNLYLNYKVRNSLKLFAQDTDLINLILQKNFRLMRFAKM